MPHPWIATKDIGELRRRPPCSARFFRQFTQELHGQRDVAMKEVASIIGGTIGKPKLGYMQVPFMMLEPALVQIGMQRNTAALIIEMWKAMNAGLIVPRATHREEHNSDIDRNFDHRNFRPAYNSIAAHA